jgi:hypothetical protein
MEATDKTEKPKGRAFNIGIKLSDEKGQAKLEKFKVKIKTKSSEDLHRLLKDKMEALAYILDEEYDGNIGNEKFGDILELNVGQRAKHTGDKELTIENIRKEVEEVGIPAWRVEITESKLCICCDSAVGSNNCYSNENGDGFLCESCWDHDHSEHTTVVRFSYDDDPLDAHTIGEYHNDTEGEFNVVWHRTDAWRGYSEIVPSEKWAKLHSDAGLSMSEDEKNLADFDKLIRAKLKKEGIEWARVISPTSNIFCCGYDFYVEADKLEQAEEMVELLRRQLRDPTDFAITAMTGKNPKDCGPKDIVFAAVATKILSGKGTEG